MFQYGGSTTVALIGGIYNNIPALEACLVDASYNGAGIFAFLGDMTGCCGHSNEAITLIRQHFQIVLADNHIQKTSEGALVCGCDYNKFADEKYGCLAHQYVMDSLSATHREWLKTLPDKAVLETGQGKILLCHGCEFPYEGQLDDFCLAGWIMEYGAVGICCIHTGLPWVRNLSDSRFVVNCGDMGKSDNDGDPASGHYVLLRPKDDRFKVEIRRVEYNHGAWSRQLETEVVDQLFVGPDKAGVLTSGVASIPWWEQERRCVS